MDKTGVFIVVVLVIGIVGYVLKTMLDVWKNKALKRSNLYEWEDRL